MIEHIYASSTHQHHQQVPYAMTKRTSSFNNRERRMIQTDLTLQGTTQLHNTSALLELHAANFPIFVRTAELAHCPRWRAHWTLCGLPMPKPSLSPTRSVLRYGAMVGSSNANLNQVHQFTSFHYFPACTRYVQKLATALPHPNEP